MKAGHYSLDIAIDHRRRPTKGDRGNGCRRVRANARQRLQRFLRIREPPRKVTGYDLGAAMQIARPGVVSEPRPCVQYVIKWRRRQCMNIGPATKESVEVANNGRHRRLLQHDFR